MTDHTTNVTPVKLCECGCGLPAPIAAKNHTRFGHVKGQPMRFRVGHAHRVTPIEERFWAKVQKTDTCWLWTGATTGGYGVLNSGGVDAKIIRAPRLSYEIHNGPIVGDFDICHRCDNPACVRPDHLFLGTAKDNVADMMAKGRGNKTTENAAKGEQHGMAKLNAEQVLAIRAKYATGTTSTRKLAAEFNISRRSIMFIVQRKHWAHI